MAKRGWQQQSTGGEAGTSVIIVYNMPPADAAKTSEWSSAENQKRLKLTDTAEMETEPGNFQIGSQQLGVTVVDTDMEDVEQKRDDIEKHVKCSGPKPGELFFHKFF